MTLLAYTLRGQEREDAADALDYAASALARVLRAEQSITPEAEATRIRARMARWSALADRLRETGEEESAR